MAIVMMIGEKRYQELLAEGKEEVYQVDEATSKRWGWTSETPIYMRKFAHGRVLRTGERNGYHDSDFYAVVWSWEKMRPVEVTYASTRGWTYPNNATVDASQEVLEAYDAWAERREAAARQARAEALEREVEKALLYENFEKGDQVEVYKGRKVPVGTTGVVVWTGASQWGPRIGIKDVTGDVHWTAASNARRIISDKFDDETWVEYKARYEEARAEHRGQMLDLAPEIGETVQIEGGIQGRVFWRKVYDSGVRLGVRIGTAKSALPHWVWANEVRIIK